MRLRGQVCKPSKTISLFHTFRIIKSFLLTGALPMGCRDAESENDQKGEGGGLSF